MLLLLLLRDAVIKDVVEPLRDRFPQHRRQRRSREFNIAAGCATRFRLEQQQQFVVVVVVL